MKWAFILSFLLNLIGLTWLFQPQQDFFEKHFSPTFPSPRSNTYYKLKKELFRRAKPKEPKALIIMLGNSLTDYFEWQEVISGYQVLNWGISGDNVERIIGRTNGHPVSSPHAIFIEVGINDLLSLNRPPHDILENYNRLIQGLKSLFPTSHLVIQSLLPTKKMAHWKQKSLEIFPRAISEINNGLIDLANLHGVHYLDLHSKFANRLGDLPAGYSHDGLHLNGLGYEIWTNEVQHLLKRLK